MAVSFSPDRLRSSTRFPARPLALDEVRLLDIGMPLLVAGPPELGPPAKERQLRLFNPSIVPSPSGLCPRCSFLVALRADALHQCDASSPLQRREPGMPAVVATNAWFKGTVLAVLDSQLRLLGWTWLLVDPEKQASPFAEGKHNGGGAGADANRSGWWAPPGAADGFAPPWSAHAIDTRLLNFGGERILATFVRSCHAHQPCHFGVSQLHITAEPTADGGLQAVRAWAHPTVSSSEPWAQGRNQALFASAAASAAGGGTATDGPLGLFVQPWPGLVASFGTPTFERHRVTCSPWAARGQRPLARARARGPSERGPSERPEREARARVRAAWATSREGGRGGASGPLSPPRLSSPHRSSPAVGRALRAVYTMWERRINRALCSVTPAGTVLNLDLLVVGGRRKGGGRHGGGGAHQRKHAAAGPTKRRTKRRSRRRATERIAGSAVDDTPSAASSSSISAFIPASIPTSSMPTSSSPSTMSTPAFGKLGLVHNHTGRLSSLPDLKYRSLTTNVLMLTRGPTISPSASSSASSPASSASSSPCRALVGIGHIHRSEGELRRRQSPQPTRPNRRPTRPPAVDGHAEPSPDAAPFKFGADYDHFIYTLEPTPPFAPLGVSDDFCLGTPSDSSDCERVQFVSGLAHVCRRNASTASADSADSAASAASAASDDCGEGSTPSLLLAYGVNDCEARTGYLPLERVWRMLRPLPGAADVCVPDGAQRTR